MPPGQVGCGMAPLAYGDVETARETAQHNLRLLADLAREGCPILCSEPTAALMLRHDALDLLDDPDARLVAVADRRIAPPSCGTCTSRAGCAPTFSRLDASRRPSRALPPQGAGPAARRARSCCALIPGLRVHTIDVSCSGMAGTFGLKADNYAVSLAAGRPMLEELARPRVLFGSTECSTCRMQMEDGGRQAHPAPGPVPGPGLRPDAGAGPPARQEPIRESGVAIGVSGRPLRQKQGEILSMSGNAEGVACGSLVRPGQGPRRLRGRRVPGGGRGDRGDVRRGWRRNTRRWRSLLEHSAVAVDDEFADDADAAARTAPRLPCCRR